MLFDKGRSTIANTNFNDTYPNLILDYNFDPNANP